MRFTYITECTQIEKRSIEVISNNKSTKIEWIVRENYEQYLRKSARQAGAWQSNRNAKPQLGL